MIIFYSVQGRSAGKEISGAVARIEIIVKKKTESFLQETVNVNDLFVGHNYEIAF